jgi:hypothetical protein
MAVRSVSLQKKVFHNIPPNHEAIQHLDRNLLQKARILEGQQAFGSHGGNPLLLVLLRCPHCPHCFPPPSSSVLLFIGPRCGVEDRVEDLQLEHAVQLDRRV